MMPLWEAVRTWRDSKWIIGEVWLDSLILRRHQEDVLALKDIHVRIRLWPLIQGKIHVSSTAVDRAVGRLWQEENGQLNLQALFDKPSGSSETSTPYRVDRLSIQSIDLAYADADQSYRLEDAAFAGTIRGGAEGFVLLDSDLEGRFQGELFSAQMERLELGAVFFGGIAG